MDIAGLGRTPIPGDRPAGRDARYEPEYAQLQAEIDKLNSVTLIAEVDWKRVVDLAGAILADKAKDLLAAAYLSVGLTQTRGLAGLALGLQVLKDLSVTFWDDCFPPGKRIRGRVNAFSWWEEKTLAWLKNPPASEPLPWEEHQGLMNDIKALDQALGECLPELPPMRELINVLNRLPVTRPQGPEAAADQKTDQTPDQTHHQTPDQKLDQKLDQKTPEQTSGRDLEAAAATGPPAAAPEETRAARKELARAALSLANLARKEDPADPWAWKAARLAAWINVRALPPAQGGQTMIPGPDPTIKTALQTLLADGKYLDAARTAEEHFTGAIFWLDLQRMIAGALDALGPDLAAALDAVRGEVGQMLRRLQGVEQLSFADGTPFADHETRAWLLSLHAPERDRQPDAASPGQKQVEETMEQARRRFAKKDEAGALDLISQAMRQAPDGPSRLRLRLGQMDLLCRAGRFAMAAALADELLAEVETRGLEDWDPGLAVQILLASREAHVGLGGEDNQAKARALAARISRIRPSAAMNLV